MKTEPFERILKEKEIQFRANEPMSGHTTFRIGGAADVFITVSSLRQLKCVIDAAKSTDTPLFCIGRGSNLLVSDEGIDGAVLSLSEINEISVSENEIVCGAGAQLSALCIAAERAGLSGLEFAYGIPGSVGGAVYMNAGAYGGEISDVLADVTAMDRSGTVQTLEAAELALGYRTSAFKQNGMIIVSARFKLKPASVSDIRGKMEELLARRKEKQPLEYPSAGSTFKRPQGYFAGALIEECSLKGYSIGGAQVSEKHAGFVINKGDATSSDIAALIDYVRKTVYENKGVMLEPEVRFLGEF